jgi:hypothetical protein
VREGQLREVAGQVAAMHLALDALEDRACPPVLRLAAWKYVYRGQAEPFLGLLRCAAKQVAA